MDRKIKVLWFCNNLLTGEKIARTGSWLHSMSSGLIQSGEIDLYNITHGKVKSTTKDESLFINQWILPKHKLNNSGLPNKKIIQDIQKIVAEIQPDIIHVWGTESYWGLITARNLIKGKVLLEIQGLKFEISKYFYSGLKKREVWSCINIKELIKPSTSVFSLRNAFDRWGKLEKEMICKHQYINTQSDWVRASINRINNDAKKYEAVMSLRDEFYGAKKWSIDSCTRFRLFTSTSAIVSYKGLHTLIDAIALLVIDFPDIQLNIASNVIKGIRRDGYTRFLFKKIKKLGLSNNIHWLGSLNAQEIVKELQAANVAIVPSFVESYCMVLNEAISLGVPTVASFSGAMPELGKHRETISYYQPGDAGMCAYEIKRIIEDDQIAVHLSEGASNSQVVRQNKTAIDKQINTYKDLISR